MNKAPARTAQNQLDRGVAAVTTAGVTPELVRDVTEKVYALLLADLKREQERMPVMRERGRAPGRGQRR